MLFQLRIFEVLIGTHEKAEPTFKYKLYIEVAFY